MRTWRLPEKWQNEDVVKFEQTEIKNISDTMAMLKLQKNLKVSCILLSAHSPVRGLSARKMKVGTLR